MIRPFNFIHGAVLFFLAAAFNLAAQTTAVQYLSGHDKDDAVPWKFFCTGGAQSGYWTNLAVPSNWELHGFGSLNYYRDATNPPPESGLYEHDFAVPADWAGKRIFLVFDGSMTDTSAKLNGQSVGTIHQGSFYRFKYEVTSLIKNGASNRLEVRVDKHSANKSVNGAERTADYWVFGGIFRPVYLEAVPQQFIARVAVNAKADGTFAMNVFADAPDVDTIEAQIKTLDGKAVGNVFTGKISGGNAILATEIVSPKLWTAETPNLYEVEVALKENGKVLHQISQRFGFRTMEVREGDGLYVNGHKVILKGADRHSFWPESGRALSDAVHRLDIETMKDANMNAVRMSHYPPDARFLDLCDELGLYVLDELGGWHNHYDTQVGTKLVEEMVTRDVNHPCILFWDNGNEGGWNTALDDVFGQFDPQQRHVLHPWAIHGGVNTAHYRPYESAKQLCASNMIYMPTEFEHGLFDGGAAAGLADYWKLMTGSKIGAGGFIWALLDEGVKRPDTGQIDVAGNQAPDGIVGPYRQREGSFYAVKQIWSPIQILETNLPENFDGTLTVENHFNFLDAKQCKFTWQLRRFILPNAASSETVSAEGVAELPSIAPGETGKLHLNLPENFRHISETTEGDFLAVRAEDPNGRELWTWVWPLRQRKVLSDDVKIVAHAENFGDVNAGTIELKGKDIVARIDGKSGELVGIERAGKKFSLSNGPRLAGKNSTLKNIAWRLRADGWLQCDYAYAADGESETFGVTFDYPENLVTHKRWLGDGPYRVWKNRLQGVTPGLWENDYNNTITGFRDWAYPEFKGIFANVRWLQLETAEGKITVAPDNIPFVQVLTPEFPPLKIAGKTLPSIPQAGLGFLDAIPPVGSKFHNAKDSGPQSQPNVLHGDYHGTVSFYFGNLNATQ